jgi:ribosome maturation factor RimP
MPRSQPDQLHAQLYPVVEGVVTAAGFDLEEIDIRQAGRRRLFRIVVDSDHGVGLDDIATLSRRIAAGLDMHDDVLCGPYTLEVTSPGVDRPLIAPRHWRRAHLRLVEVALRESGKITGRVGASDEDRVQLLVGGTLREVRYADVERASVVVEFRQPPAEELRLLTGSTGPTAGSANSEDRPAGGLDVDGETEEQR